MVTINLLVVGGVVLAAIAMLGTFIAGSDGARIGGHTQPIMAVCVLLMIAALLLEYHARPLPLSPRPAVGAQTKEDV